MAEQPQLFEYARAGREKSRARQIACGDLVSNAPFRERVEFLMAHDPDFSLMIVCERMANLGFPSFTKRYPSRTGKRQYKHDTTHLLRLLGMRDQTTKTVKGRRYPTPPRTSYVAYDLAVALCRALELDPVDCDV